jgi:hypothetical protein
MDRIDRKFRLPRIWSNTELGKFSQLFVGKVINVSAGENVDKEGSTYDTYFTNANEYWISNYNPGSFRGFDSRKNELLIDLLHPLDIKYHRKFEVVFNHTTMEHVFDIFTAFKNICLLSNDIVILVVPFVQEQHENISYKDYWRFTPTCIRKLFETNGFTVLYESANNDVNAGTYLFHIATLQPEKWKGIFTESIPITTAGDWIGT